MINFWLALRNPFPCEPFKNIWDYTGKVSRFKAWEIQFSRYAFNLFEIQLDLNWRQTDHAGPWIMINVLGFTLDLRLYDTRHWDDETNTWAIVDGKPV